MEKTTKFIKETTLHSVSFTKLYSNSVLTFIVKITESSLRAKAERSSLKKQNTF